MFAGRGGLPGLCMPVPLLLRLAWEGAELRIDAWRGALHNNALIEFLPKS
jgi:hypothetical protein